MSQVLLAAGGTWQLAWIVLVIFAAYGLRGATGFGAGVVAVPLLALVLPVAVVIPLVTATGMFASLGQGVHQRRHVEWAAFRRLIIPSFIGIGAGLWLFAALEQERLLFLLALFIIGYALSGLLPLRPFAAPRWLAPLAGALGGFVATIFGGMAGPFFVVYLRGLALDKTRFRATVSVALVSISIVRAAGYAGLGLYGERALWLLALSLPIMVAAMMAGDRWHRRMDEARFGRVVAVLLALSGVALLFK